MIKAVIIDDEKWVRLNFHTLLKKVCPKIEILGDANGVESGLRVIKSLKPNLVFLDIHMKDGSGFDLLDQLDEIDFQIIFFTAYDEYAVKAFKYSAIDYLLKPIHPEELKEAVSRVVKSIKHNPYTNNIVNLLENLRKDKFEKLAIATMDGFTFLGLTNIIRIESDSNYCIFYLKDNTKIISSKTLKYYEDLLDPEIFIRIHRSHLINIQYVKKHVIKDGGCVILNNGDQLPLSRRKKEDFHKIMNLYYNM